MRRSIVAAVTIFALPLAPPRPAPAQADVPALFVLPVRTDRWLGPWLAPGEPRLLEARLVATLARARRVRPLGPRDVPATARAILPRDLAACVTPDCLRALGSATGAERVLALEALEEGDGPVLFATLYDAGDGHVIDQREVPRPDREPATRGWADDVARWVLVAPARAVPPPERYPRLGVWLAPQQAGRPEAQALAAELTARLRASGSLRLPGADAPATHAAVIAVDRIAVTDRLHHVHRYRQGLLTASIVVTDTRTGVVVLRRRDDADLTERSDRIDNQRMVAALVSDVASRWLVVLEDPSLVQLMTGKGEP